MTTVLETMESDRDLFLNTTENPEAKSAVYTPLGGIAQAAVIGLFIHIPLHGDEHQNEEVEQPIIRFSAKSSDVAGWLKNGNLLVSGTNYQIINAPYPKQADNLWSIIPLRLPEGQETRI